jgi:hypothetical protein
MSLTTRFASLVDKLPAKVRGTVDRYLEMIDLVREIKDPRVARSLGPSGLRGLVLRRGKQGTPTEFQASHRAYFDWTYPSDHPEMDELYRRAKRGQWDGETYLDWSISVDPRNPEVPVLPDGYFDFSLLPSRIKLDRAEQLHFNHDAVTWMLSQFLHGEQGALMAAAQVTEAVQFFDGKYYGATQVVDEARHVEVFHRYLDTKLEKLYQVNDNLFVIIDALMEDSRWDMKFLGMQIMVEGLALGAFGTLYKITLRRARAARAHHQAPVRERASRARAVGVRGRAADAQPVHGLRGLRGVVRGPDLARGVAPVHPRRARHGDVPPHDVLAAGPQPARDRPAVRSHQGGLRPRRSDEVLRRPVGRPPDRRDPARGSRARRGVLGGVNSA